MSLGTLARRLADEQNRLRQLAAGDVEVRASFALSYRGLSPDLAFMFRRLGLVAGPDFARGLAAALTDTIPEEAEELLEALVDAHLLENAVAPGRYRFHDLLRLYARECLQTDETVADREAALRRMLTWYLEGVTAAARQLNPGRQGLLHQRECDKAGRVTFTRSQALAWFDTEWVNLIAATHQAAECGHDHFAWQIPDALYTFASLRRNWMDWRDACLVGRTAAHDAHDTQAEAWMLTGVGIGSHRLRRYQEAIDCLDRALEMHRDIGDRCGEGLALASLGLAHRQIEHFDQFVGYLLFAHHTPLDLGEASGPAQRQLPHFDESIGYFQQALAIHRDLKDRYSEAWDLHDLGSTSIGRRRFHEAIAYHQQALAIHLEMGDRRGEAWAHGYLALGHYCLRRFDEAIDHYQRALAMTREVGHRYGESLALTGLATAYTAVECFEEALDSLQQALAIHREMGDRYGEAWILDLLGSTLQYSHGMEAARELWQEALQIFTELEAVQADDVRARLEGGDSGPLGS